MSLPTISYHKGQKYYLPPYGAPVVPTKFTSRQQCRNYYDRVKVHVQLNHNGTWQHSEKMLYQFVYVGHSKYFVDLIKRFSNGHKNSRCTGCFRCATGEFWYRFEKASRKASHRYVSILEDIKPENSIERVARALLEIEKVTDLREFFEENMSKLESTLRHWPGIDTLARTVGMLTSTLPGLDGMLLRKLGKGRISIESDGVISIPYSACIPDVIRRVTEVVIENAGKLNEIKMFLTYGLAVQAYPEEMFSTDPRSFERQASFATTLVGDDEPALGNSRDIESTAEPSCLFCGSNKGHNYENCPLFECIAESGVLRLGYDGSVCDYDGKRLKFDSVPWCSCEYFLAYLANRP